MPPAFSASRTGGMPKASRDRSLRALAIYMTPFRAFIVALLLQPLLIADDQTLIQQEINSWNWTAGPPNIVLPPTPGCLVISITYEKPFVVKDTDTYGVISRREGDHSFSTFGFFKSRCGSNGYFCSGAPRLKRITENGFGIDFDLKWRNKAEGAGEFKESFDCKWIPEQKFNRDGFAITVTITKQK
jgi:hypothetical protein